MTREQVSARRAEILAAAELRGASDVRLIGSVARGEQGSDSDVDFLVRFAPGRSLADLGELAAALEDLLGLGVHVIAEGGHNERLQARVLADAVPVDP